MRPKLVLLLQPEQQFLIVNVSDDFALNSSAVILFIKFSLRVILGTTKQECENALWALIYYAQTR